MSKTIFLSILVALTAFASFNFVKDAGVSTNTDLQIEEAEGSYYESIDDFLPVVNDALSEIQNSANSSGDTYGFTIHRSSDGYSIGLVTNLSGSDIVPDDLERCDCGTGIGGSELNSMLDNDPCWWMVAFTGGVWGWDGC